MLILEGNLAKVRVESVFSVLSEDRVLSFFYCWPESLDFWGKCNCATKSKKRGQLS